MTNKIVAWFEEIDKGDVAVVGGKGANLGEMTSFGMPVPPGFVVTAHAYRTFIAENHLKEKIHAVLDSLNVNDPVQLQKASVAIKKLIVQSPIPVEISQEIMTSYAKLGKKLHKSRNRMTRLLSSVRHPDVSVAVRSSATSEDSKDASFAGQNETFLNIKGDANVADAVRRCWASLFEARSIFYRKERHFDHFQSYIAVVVQAIVPTGRLTKFALCMPDKYKDNNPVTAYRNFYRAEKNSGRLGTWKQNKPEWW
jgi:pyruvate,water dikinase